jgi:hypothetical protein
MVMAPGGTALASWGSTTDPVRVWKLPAEDAGGKALDLPRRELVSWGAFRPGGKMLLTGGSAGTRLWDTATLKQRGTPLAFTGLAGTFHPDGRTVAVGDSVVRQVDVETGRETGLPLEHAARPSALAYTADGALLLTASAAGCWVWHAETGKRIGPALPGTALAVEPGRPSVAVAGEGKLQLWPLPVPVEGELGRVRAWVQAITGKELSDGNVLRDLSPERWQQAREEAEQ